MREKRTAVLSACPSCGGNFWTTPGRIAAGRGIYCSRSCVKEPRPLVTHPTDPAALLVPLTRGLFATIHRSDTELVSGRNWSAQRARNGWYAKTDTQVDGFIARLLMHRVIVGASGDVVVDHADGDGLNNRRDNLREATISQNNQNAKKRPNNTSGYKGVAWDKQHGCWQAGIGVGGRRIHLGLFANAEEAARCYDEAARERFGKFGRFNFPHEGERAA